MGRESPVPNTNQQAAPVPHWLDSELGVVCVRCQHTSLVITQQKAKKFIYGSCTASTFVAEMIQDLKVLVTGRVCRSN